MGVMLIVDNFWLTKKVIYLIDMGCKSEGRASLDKVVQTVETPCCVSFSLPMCASLDKVVQTVETSFSQFSRLQTSALH